MQRLRTVFNSPLHNERKQNNALTGIPFFTLKIQFGEMRKKSCLGLGQILFKNNDGSPTGQILPYIAQGAMV